MRYNWGGGGVTGSQPHPELPMWFKTFSYLFGPHSETQCIIKVTQIKYYEVSKTRTQKIQRAVWQLEIPQKPNNTSENLK